MSYIYHLSLGPMHSPEKLRESDHIPVVTFHLDRPIRNKILNYKRTVKEIYKNYRSRR